MVAAAANKRLYNADCAHLLSVTAAKSINPFFFRSKHDVYITQIFEGERLLLQNLSYSVF